MIASSLYATTHDDFLAIPEELEGAQIGIYIEDGRTTEEAFSSHKKMHFQIGSLVKMATAYGALKTLGSAYRYETHLAHTGVIDKNGVLKGDIVVVGGGDPTLNAESIPEWGFAVKKHGIHAIQGRVLVDASCFETLGASPYWEYRDLGNYYAAGASGISINHNQYTVSFRPSDIRGNPAEVISIEPKIPSLVYSNEVRTAEAGSGDQAYIFGSEYSPLHIFRGTVPQGKNIFLIKGAIPDPARFCGDALTRHLGLKKHPKVIRSKEKSVEKYEVIQTKKSPQLRQIVREMIERSDNLYAEHLIRSIGNGMSEEGLSTLTTLLKESGVSLHLKDGCGAARSNLASPEQMTRLVRFFRGNEEGQIIIDALPEWGVSGTLAKLPSIQGARVFAKTGSMSNVFNVAGIISLQDGRTYNFCICVNNFTCQKRSVQEYIFAFLSTFIDEIT